MAYNRISIKPYITSHLELQREITLIKLAPSPYFFVSSICLAFINMFARFDENPEMTLQDIRETKRYGRTQATDNVKTVYPPQTKFAGDINTDKYLLVLTDRFSDLDLECDEGDCECDVLYSGMAMLYSLGLSY